MFLPVCPLVLLSLVSEQTPARDHPRQPQNPHSTRANTRLRLFVVSFLLVVQLQSWVGIAGKRKLESITRKETKRKEDWTGLRKY